MADENRSKLVRLSIKNIGCVGQEELSIELNNVVCLVGQNNVGKSTILRAYELAKGSSAFDAQRDRHQHAPDDQPSEVILDVHIPDGIGNVDSRWKMDAGDLKIVRSRWQWLPPEFKRVRTTWDPKIGEHGQGAWAEEGKAGGADPVFNSRLPRAIRIGSLEDAGKTEDMLLALALAPLVSSLENEKANAQSALSSALSKVTDHIEAMSAEHELHFNAVAGKIASSFQGVFPGLNIKLDVTPSPLAPKLGELLKGGSGIKIKEGQTETKLNQQGTGSRRALFWAMLQVFNEMTRENDIRSEYRKALCGELLAVEKKLLKGTTDELTKKKEEIETLLASFDAGAPIPDSPEDPAFPGYLLLIDEPENALHPMAARAAQRHLYKLAESADWQVMLTTHSPYFINPFEDHTTIVRLERSGENTVSPRTFRADTVEFEKGEKERLQALQHIDPSFAEIFFGSFPIVVEGDTEHAAFISSITERNHDLINKVTIIRARGKAIIPSIIKVLRHFKINFGALHDCDPPFRRSGDKNGMWSINKTIRDEIVKARESGIVVRHRISVPDFERRLGGDEESKDKPITAYNRIKDDEKLAGIVQDLLTELIEGEVYEPYDNTTFPPGADYLEMLGKVIGAWAEDNGLSDEPRFKGKAH